MKAGRALVLVGLLGLLLSAAGAVEVQRRGQSVIAGKARFTVLTPTLLRLEYSPTGKFEEGPSVLVVNRKFPPAPFKAERVGDRIRVSTSNVVLEYKVGSGPFNERNLRIRYLVDGKFEEWRPGRPDPLNLGGTRGSLDGIGEHNLPELPPGLLSRSGCHLLADGTPLREGGWIVPRPRGYLDWYFFGYGLDYLRALREFVALCGRIPMIPKWAFGSWYSRYWPYSDAEERELIRRFRSEGLPLDVLVIDVDWHLHGWHGWDWNPKYFPDPQGFLKWARERGVKVTLNIHPGFLPKSDSHFPEVCRRLGLDPAKVKEGYRFDIAKREEAEAYMEVLHAPLLDQGVEFFWIDGSCSARMPGLSGLLWTNEVYYKFQERHLGRRTLILSRYGGLGNHRYPVAFSGDTFSQWGVLNYEVYFTATAGNVGVAYWSHDIGGFHGKKLPAELYVRWVQFGALSPILRLHSNHGIREPWNYGREALDICRDFYRLRYRLLPYLYTLSRLTYETGSPLCRPLYLHWPREGWAYKYRHQYLLGEDLLVAPVAEPTEGGFATKEVCFPPGIWHDVFTGEVYKGPRAVVVRSPLRRMPLYAREGAIIPLAPEMDYVGQRPEDPLTILYFAGRDGAFDLYADDGVSLGYKRGEFAWTPIRAREEGRRLTVTVGPTEGRFEGQRERRSYILRVVGRAAPKRVLVGGRAIPEVSLDELDKAKVGWAFEPSRFETIVKLPEASIRKPLTVALVGGPGKAAYGTVRQLLSLSARLWEAVEASEFVPLPARIESEARALHGECARLKRLFGEGRVPLDVAAGKVALLRRRANELAERAALECKDRRALAALLGALWGLSAKARIVGVEKGKAKLAALLSTGPFAPELSVRFAARAPEGWKVEGPGATEKVALPPGGRAEAAFDLVRVGRALPLGIVKFEVEAKVGWGGLRLSLPMSVALDNTFVTQFVVIGPFDNKGNKGMERAYPPEEEFDLKAAYRGKGGVEARWRRLEWRPLMPSQVPRGAYVNLKALFKPDADVVAYALTHIWAPRPTKALFSLGTDDGVVVWVNGRRVHYNPAPRPAVPGQDKVLVNLRAGWNRVLLKVGQLGGDWGFYFQVLGPDGRPAKGLYNSALP